jgi:hypothetical protein
MARKATGQVIPPKGNHKSWALRFTAYGKRRFVTLCPIAARWFSINSTLSARRVGSTSGCSFVMKRKRPTTSGARPRRTKSSSVGTC